MLSAPNQQKVRREQPKAQRSIDPPEDRIEFAFRSEKQNTPTHFPGFRRFPIIDKSSPSIREQAIAISKELRDPGAVNKSLYESNAPQAAELKAKIYQLLEKTADKSMMRPPIQIQLTKGRMLRRTKNTSLLNRLPIET